MDGSFDCIALGTSPGVTNDTKPMQGMPVAFGALSHAARPYVTAIHVLILMLDRSASKSAPPVRHHRGHIARPSPDGHQHRKAQEYARPAK